MFVCIFSLLFIFFETYQASAQVHKGLNFQGVIKLPPTATYPSGKYPTETGLTVTAQILSPNRCILLEEQFINMKVTNGFLNLIIGNGKRTTSDHAFSLANVMDNSQTFSSLNCINSDGSPNSSFNSYDPSMDTTGGSRKFRFSLVVDSVSIQTEFNMRSVAYAVNSETLDGKTKDQFFQTSSAFTQTKLESWLSNNFLQSIIDGTYIAPNALTATTAATASGLAPEYNVPITNGGTGRATLPANNLLLGNGTAALQSVAPGPSGNILTSDGTTWISQNPSTSSAATLSNVIAGNGLTGGGPGVGGSVTISLPNVGTAGSYFKVTTDTEGRIISGSNLLATSDIPALDASKITSGTMAQDVNSMNVAGANGTFTSLRIFDGASKSLIMNYPVGGNGYTLRWPLYLGLNGQVLQTDGSGNLAWSTLSTSPVNSVSGKTGAVTLSTSDIVGFAEAVAANTTSKIDSSQMPANCTSGQTLTFSSPSGTWVCSNISIAWTQLSIGKPTTLSGYGITDGLSKSGDSMTGSLIYAANTGSAYKSAGNTNTVTVQGPTAAIGTSYVLRLPSSQGSASEILINDGSGNLSWGTIPLSAISSTGTSGYVPYYTSANTIGNSPIQVSGNHIEMGAGSGTPTLATTGLNSCGSGATIIGNDIRGTITPNPSNTACMITFSSIYSTAPYCVVSQKNSTAAQPIGEYAVNATTTTMTIFWNAPKGTSFNYFCIQ